MSSSTKKKKPPKFVNLTDVSKHLYCCICEEIFVKPIRIKECGHTFCKKCLKSWEKYSKNCPLCRKNFVFKNTKRDIIAYNIINDLEVFCNNDNCPWKGKLVELKKHLKKCNMDSSKMNNKLKEILEIDSNKNKRNSINGSISTINTLNEENKNEKSSFLEDDNENDEGSSSVDTITSFNTRVGLRARLFNRNKTLVNNVLNNETQKGYPKDSIFSLMDENGIKI